MPLKKKACAAELKSSPLFTTEAAVPVATTARSLVLMTPAPVLLTVPPEVNDMRLA